jgi:hypothetical protein
MRAHVASLSASGKPVLLGGDMNVAHGDADIWNVKAKHVPKSAGTTPGERAAFGQMLSECALVDTFRAAHPDAAHCYSYWSQRANNRRVRKRLPLLRRDASREAKGVLNRDAATGPPTAACAWTTGWRPPPWRRARTRAAQQRRRPRCTTPLCATRPRWA